ncbi:hypothetical protein J6366_20240, partial [Burkholderia pseudomallei]|nr:hypothetical protein [Burkholderia pseudomallei]
RSIFLLQISFTNRRLIATRAAGPALVVELPPAFDGHVGLGVAAKPFAVQLCDSQTSFHFLEDRFFGASEPVAPIGDTGSDARR